MWNMRFQLIFIRNTHITHYSLPLGRKSTNTFLLIRLMKTLFFFFLFYKTYSHQQIAIPVVQVHHLNHQRPAHSQMAGLFLKKLPHQLFNRCVYINILIISVFFFFFICRLMTFANICPFEAKRQEPRTKSIRYFKVISFSFSKFHKNMGKASRTVHRCTKQVNRWSTRSCE